MRRANCQHAGMTGGEVFGHGPKDRTCGNRVSKAQRLAGGSAANVSVSGGTVTGFQAEKYLADSTEQQPSSLQGVLVERPSSVWSALQMRNSKPGTDSSRQCEFSGTQTSASSITSVVFKVCTNGLSANSW